MNMKLRKSWVIAPVLSAILFTSCAKNEVALPVDEANSLNEELSIEKMTAVIQTYDYCIPDSAETAMLQFMREEEYLAHDVYSVFAEMYGFQIFYNIRQSEYVHTTAIRNLLNKYGLEDPAINHQPGVFQNQELQELYDSLIASGSQSSQQALEAGVAIETTDIADIQNALLITDQQDITFVLNNLMKASYRHLAAFNPWLN